MKSQRIGLSAPSVALLGLAFLLTPAPANAQSTSVILDRPGANVCAVPTSLGPESDDENNQPQGEVWIDISESGKLAAAAKDNRFGPTNDLSYNFRIWNGLYLSNDGALWKNFSFEDSTPDTGITGVTDGSYGRPAGVRQTLTHESDPVVAFDRDGVLYTSGLAYEPVGPGDPSAVVVSRRNPDGTLLAGSIRLLALENDERLFNDKNWLAVERDAPSERTMVVASWRLFTVGPNAPAQEGGWIAVSGDGAQTFSAPIRLPVPAAEAAASQFYQPLIGRDPSSGRKILYVIFRTQAGSLSMHVVKADIEGLTGTAALEARLKDPSAWTFLATRLGGITSYGGSGYDGTFRFSSFFQPAIDSTTGRLFVVFHGLDPVSRRARALISRSTDGALTWSTPAAIDDPGKGNQLMPAVAARGSKVFAVWYDSRNDVAFAPLSPIKGVDVYAAVLDDALRVERVSRLTPEVQRADRPVFTRPRPVGVSAATAGERPHDFDPRADKAGAVKSSTAALTCETERYGFIGDYIGIAANATEAWAAWTDLRDLTETGEICAVGHTCNGNRNQNIRAVRIPRS